jgi:hypothetical protein
MNLRSEIASLREKMKIDFNKHSQEVRELNVSENMINKKKLGNY